MGGGLASEGKRGRVGLGVGTRAGNGGGKLVGEGEVACEIQRVFSPEGMQARRHAQE